MGKRSQIDRAIEAMEARRQALIDKFQSEVSGIDAAVQALRAAQQQPRARRSKPTVADLAKSA